MCIDYLLSLSLQLLYVAVWAVYNTVRYFLAYKVYESSTGQAVSLVLGTLTALAFAFFSCATVISLFETRLVLHHIPIRIILTMSTAFRLLASFFLIVPAIVNLALTIVWRMSPDLDLSIRCHMDVDIVWSIVPQPCSGNPVGLGFYLGAAIIRTLITFLIIVSLQQPPICSSHSVTGCPLCIFVRISCDAPSIFTQKTS